MIDMLALRRAMTVGTLLQVTLAVLCYYSPWIAYHALFAGMMASATASFLYVQEVGPGIVRGTVIGTLIGTACAFVGFAFAVGLGVLSMDQFWFRLAVAALCGAAGGPWGQMSYRLREMGY